MVRSVKTLTKVGPMWCDDAMSKSVWDWNGVREGRVFVFFLN